MTPSSYRRRNSSELRAIVFDLDDTLYSERSYVISGFMAVASWGERTLGIPGESGLQELERLLDQGTRGNIFDLWMTGHGIPPAPWIQQAVAIYRDHRPTIVPYPGVIELLTRLSKSYRLGLLSDGLLRVQRMKLGALRLEQYFDAVVFSDELGKEAWKPSTRPFMRMAEFLQVAPEEAVYVGENSLKDFLGARKIGMLAVRVLAPAGFYTTFDPPSPEYAADLEIEDLRQLEDLLQKHPRK